MRGHPPRSERRPRPGPCDDERGHHPVILPPREIPTWCRICESQCGLVATVEGHAVTALRPDHEHPVSKGYACRKGLRFHETARRPDRLLSPRLRERPADWETALGTAGRRLAEIRREHGPESIALYLGNAIVHSIGAILGTVGLQRAIGTSKAYSALTLDNASQYRVLHECFGNAMHTFVADYAGSDCILLLGTDPLSSQPSQAQSHPEGVRELLRRRDALIVVDPRQSMTAKHASWHLPIRPGSDAVLLAFLLREALRGQTGALAEAVAPFDLARARAETGLEHLDRLAARLLAAERPLVWSGLGVLLGPDSTVGWWLTLCLQTVLGGLDRPGGWIHPPGAVDFAALWPWLGVPTGSARVVSPVGGYPAVLGNLAAATLPEDIRRGGVKALVVVGGNPAVAIPDAVRTREALASLDLLVAADLFDNETTRLADVVLPATSWLERADVNLQYANQRRIPHLQHTPPVVPAPGDCRDDWDIALGLADAMGGSFFGVPGGSWAARRLGPLGLARAAMPFSWSRLLRAPRGITADARPTSRRPKLDVPEFLAALPKIGPLPGKFRLVTSVRPVDEMNSWLGGDTPPPARMHPSELPGDRVRIVGDTGAIELPVVPDAGVARGVVVVPYGWGGQNPNDVVSATRLDAFTGQPASNGTPVDVVVVGRPPGSAPAPVEQPHRPREPAT